MKSAASQSVQLLSHRSDLLLVHGLPQQTVCKAAKYSSFLRGSHSRLSSKFVTICFMIITVVSTNVL